MSQHFRNPKLAINRVYTRTGDGGDTRLVGGQKVSKSHPRIEAYGTVDELNAHVGVARQWVQTEISDAETADAFDQILARVQHELFNLGSILATLPEDVGPQQPRIRPQDVQRLEEEIDRYSALLAPLRSFVLPGGSQSNAQLHLCRTVCRRAERLLVQLAESETIDAHSLHYLNRLSDAFFVWSRWVNAALGRDESLWDPNQSV